MQHESGFHVFGDHAPHADGRPFGWDEGNGLNLQALLAYYPAYLLTKVVGEVAAYNLVLLSGYVLSGRGDVPARPLPRLPQTRGRVGRAWSTSSSRGTSCGRRTRRSSTSSSFRSCCSALVAAARRPTLVRFGLVGVVDPRMLADCGLHRRDGVRRSRGVRGRRRPDRAAAARSCSRRWLDRIRARREPLRRLPLGRLGRRAGALGLHSVADDLSRLRAAAAELVVPAAQNIVLRHWLAVVLRGRQHGSNPTETNNYLGFLTIALRSLARRRWRRRRTLGLALASGDRRLGRPSFVVALLLAAPSPVRPPRSRRSPRRRASSGTSYRRSASRRAGSPSR